MSYDRLWAVLLALGAAGAYAAGAVLQQRAAFPAKTGQARRLTADGAVAMSAMMLSPMWVFGIAMDASAFCLEFLALRLGSVTLVGPLLVCGLIFALPLGAVVAHFPLRARDLACGALVCLSLAIFVAGARPRAGMQPASDAAWAVTLGATVLVVGALLLAARGRQRSIQATCIAAAAGLVNGVFAGISKGMGERLDSGWLALVTSWLPWALIVAAALTLTLAARAFQTGAPVAAVTALFATEPLASITVGDVVFGETVLHSPWAVAMQVTGLAACLVGVALLARSPVIVATYAHG